MQIELDNHPGTKPTVNGLGYYNEYIPIERGLDEDWPVGFFQMDKLGYSPY